MEHYTDEAIRSSDIMEAASKINVILDHGLDTSDKIPSGKVEIQTKTGQVFLNQVDYPLGSPEKPMTFDDCVRKFRDCASHTAPGLPDAQIERVIELVGRLERLGDVGEVMRQLM
jgi:2-methylcitrate dehydratase PrpD